MNYAEDRLDRRARSAAQALSSETDADGTSGASIKAESTQDQLEFDLKRAHDVFLQPLPVADDDDDTAKVQSLRDLRAAHELAGKTLRDGGRNRQAVFHFGMAWKICHWVENNTYCNSQTCDINVNVDEAENEWRSVGDYAQICEFSGFPEVGVLALLFYQAGGSLDLELIGSLTTSPVTSIDESDHDKANEEIRHQGCGCGMEDCGTSPCYIAFPLLSPIMSNILKSLDSLSVNSHEAFPTASEILAQLALMTRKSDSIGDPVRAMHAFLMERHVMRNVPSILHYWDGAGIASPQELVSDDKNDQSRVLPPVILLLLLKLLYSCPVSGPFLRLACISMPYLAARFPPSSPEGRLLARNYKSHWAYYVFIRVLIFGQRVKKHRRGKVIHHVPVWDVFFGSETSQNVGSKKEEKKEQVKQDTRLLDEEEISRYCRRILQACSSQPKQFISGRNTQNIAAHNQHRDFPLPCIVQQKMSSYSTHDPIFVVGDSHVLSLAWQTLRIDPSSSIEYPHQNDQKQSSILYRTAFPFPTTGMKAWHVRPATRFFTHFNLHACLQRLPPSSSGRTIIISAGEIDCREGIGGSLLQGYYHNCSDAVERTVVEYLASLTEIANEYMLQILVMPVAPHAYRSEKNGKAVGRARRRETMCLWNEILRRELTIGRRQALPQPNNIPSKYNRVFLLDYESRLQHSDVNSPVGYVLNPSYNADYTHVNSAIVPLVEDAILLSGCDLTLL